jgi:hypothetical protein
MQTYPVAEFQKKGKGVLGDALRGIGRDVAYGDILIFGRLYIHIVISCGHHTYEFDAGTGVHDFSGDVTFAGEDYIAVPYAIRYFGIFSSVVYGQAACAFDSFPREVSRVYSITV